MWLTVAYHLYTGWWEMTKVSSLDLNNHQIQIQSSVILEGPMDGLGRLYFRHADLATGPARRTNQYKKIKNGSSLNQESVACQRCFSRKQRKREGKEEKRGKRRKEWEYQSARQQFPFPRRIIVRVAFCQAYCGPSSRKSWAWRRWSSGCDPPSPNRRCTTVSTTTS